MTLYPLDSIERWIRGIGLATILGTISVLLWGLWHSTRRPAGYKSGHEPGILRAPVFYGLASVGYFGLCYRLWRPLPLTLSRPFRFLALFLGSLFYFLGLFLVLWGRLTLARMYNVSSSFGAHLQADHQLITGGPFTFVRHPMYFGITLVGIGGLALYRTWTFVWVIFHLPALIIRARREEMVLEAAFSEAWQAYRNRVPAWIPHYERDN